MLAIAHRMMLPSRQRKEIGTSEKPVSQLTTQPMVSPVNASRQPSRIIERGHAEIQGHRHLDVPHCADNSRTANVAFSIAALVKLFLVTSCHIPSARRSALADVAAAEAKTAFEGAQLARASFRPATG